MDAKERARLRALCATIPDGDVTPCCGRAGEDGHHSSWSLGTTPLGAAIRAWVHGPLDLLALVRTDLPALLDTLDAAERERDALLAMLRNLLARVHRDGGQHVDAVGLDAATEEADEIIVCDRAELARLRAPRPSAIVLRPVEDVPETDAPLPWDDEDQALADGDRRALDAVTRERDEARAEVERLRAERDEAHAELEAIASAAGQSVCVVIPARPGGPFAAVRSRKHQHRIELPGGKVEPGESPIAAARREVREELGVELDSDRIVPLGTFLHVFDGRLWCAHAFLGDIGGAHLGEGDAGETTWATRASLVAGTYGPVVARIFAACDAIRARGAGGGA